MCVYIYTHTHIYNLFFFFCPRSVGFLYQNVVFFYQNVVLLLVLIFPVEVRKFEFSTRTIFSDMGQFFFRSMGQTPGILQPILMEVAVKQMLVICSEKEVGLRGKINK